MAKRRDEVEEEEEQGVEVRHHQCSWVERMSWRGLGGNIMSLVAKRRVEVEEEEEQGVEVRHHQCSWVERMSWRGVGR